MADDPSAADRNVEIWKIKKLIKSLEAARGWAPHLGPPMPSWFRDPSGWPPPRRMAGWGEPGTSQLPPSGPVGSNFSPRCEGLRRWPQKGQFSVLGLGGPAPGTRTTRPPRGRPLLLLYLSQALNPAPPFLSSRCHPPRVLLGERARPSFPKALPWFPLSLPLHS